MQKLIGSLQNPHCGLWRPLNQALMGPVTSLHSVLWARVPSEGLLVGPFIFTACKQQMELPGLEASKRARRLCPHQLASGGIHSPALQRVMGTDS